MSAAEGRAKPATISDVALAAGVSRTTVSRYLSNQTGSMSAATHKRIKSAIAQLNYRPSRMARGLRQDKSFTIGFIVPDLTNPFAISVLRGAEAVAEGRGYMLMVCNSDRDPTKERRYLEALRSYGIDGLLIFTTGQNNEMVAQLAEASLPMVLVDQSIPDLGLDLVGSDNTAAMRGAVEHLLEGGYDDIGYFTDVTGATASRLERAEVFRSVLESHQGVAARIYEANVRDDSQLDARLDEFLAEPKGAVRCVFAGNGVMMLKLYSRLKERVSMPSEISLIGFDDDEWARSAEPPLTTIAQATREIGSRAAELLLARIDGGSEAAQTLRLPTTLIVRGSTPARAGRDRRVSG